MREQFQKAQTNKDKLSHVSEPIFQKIFDTEWNSLPPVFKTHYFLRPYSNETIIATGYLDICCAKILLLLAPVFRLLNSVPLINASAIPVSVTFQSWEDSDSFGLNRRFDFNNRQPYNFRTRMVHTKGTEVIEIMGYGISWVIDYSWQDSHVNLRHKGYALKVRNIFIPLPITWLIGRCDAQEWAIDDKTFEMCATITHKVFGKIYEYKGRFHFT